LLKTGLVDVVGSTARHCHRLVLFSGQRTDKSWAAMLFSVHGDGVVIWWTGLVWKLQVEKYYWIFYVSELWILAKNIMLAWTTVQWPIVKNKIHHSWDISSLVAVCHLHLQLNLWLVVWRDNVCGVMENSHRWILLCICVRKISSTIIMHVLVVQPSWISCCRGRRHRHDSWRRHIDDDVLMPYRVNDDVIIGRHCTTSSSSVSCKHTDFYLYHFSTDF